MASMAPELFSLTPQWSRIDIWDYASLPDTPGVYVNLKPSSHPKSYFLLYTGKSGSLSARWKAGHHKAIEILHHGGINIAYLQTSIREAAIYESEIIRVWNPPLNKKQGDKWRKGLSAFQQMKAIYMEVPEFPRMFFEKTLERRKSIEDSLRKQYGFEWEADEHG